MQKSGVEGLVEGRAPKAVVRRTLNFKGSS